MGLRAYISTLLFSFSFFSHAQTELFVDAIRDYSAATSRLLTYEAITIEWKMQGKLQAELNEGINNLLEGNPSVAEVNFSEVIQRDSTIWQAYYYRGICLKQLGRLADGRKDMLHVISTNHVLYEGYLELGKIAQLFYNVQEAQKNFDKAIQVNPKNPTAYYLKANLQLDQNQKKDAIKNFNTCLQHDSLYFDARIKLGILEIAAKEKVDAGLPQLNGVLRNDSLNRYALLFRSLVIFNTNQKQCLADLNNLVRVSPNNLMALYLRGLLLSALGDYGRAFPDFHKVIEATYESENKFVGMQTWLDKKIDLQNAGAYTVSRVYGQRDDDAIKIKKAYCLLIIGDFGETLNTINQTSVSNTDPLCLFLKGVACEHRGSHGSALKFYSQALALDNDILDAHKKRGIYEQELKEWSKSIADFTEVLRINPQTFMVYKIRGVSYFYENMFPNAIADFSRYLQRDSTNKEIIGYRGLAYLKDGQFLKASVDFAGSGNVHMLDFKKLAKSIDSLLHEGDTVNAFTYLNKLTKSVPSSRKAMC